MDLFHGRRSPGLSTKNTANPLVFPTNTTAYIVQLNQDGCISTDTITVRVVDHVTLDAGPDSTICLTDSARLHPSTNALSFAWTPAATLNNSKLKKPCSQARCNHHLSTDCHHWQVQCC